MYMGKTQGTMEQKSEMTPNQTGSSAAATLHKPYSAQELGEMMNIAPLELLKMDIGYQTRWYNCEFIEEIFRYIEKEPNIKILMSYIVVKWRSQGDDRNPNVCHYDPSLRTWIPYVQNLTQELYKVYERVMAYRKHKEEERQMEEQWKILFGGQEQNNLSSDNTIPAHLIQIESDILHVGSNNNVDYRLDDLPADVKAQILIEDNRIYSDLVNTLKGPVSQWIDKHNLKDWNVVRFICRLRGIVTRKCSMGIFGKFLEIIGLGNQESNMKQRQDANKDIYLNDYDDPKKKQNFWKLKKDGDAIEKLLKPIIDKMSA